MARLIASFVVNFDCMETYLWLALLISVFGGLIGALIESEEDS